MDDHGREIWSGAVDTWECDANGHMNVRFYVARSMEALAFMAAELGMPRAFAREAQSTLVVREHHIRFMREARVWDALVITGGVVEIGETDARLLLTMRHLGGEVAAVFQTVVEHVTAGELRPFPWPDRVRQAAAAWAASVPDDLLPRSIGVEPISPQACLARALDLGMRRGSLGTVSNESCDAFGRARAESFIGRISDGISRVTHAHPTGRQKRDRKIGGAVLEYRLIYLNWPRAGDRIEMRSGVAGCNERVRFMVHWLVDPETGRPWVSAQAVAAALDMETRKMVRLSPEDQAAINADAIQGLGY